MRASARLLDRDRAALLFVDVQERINAVMADQAHVVRQRVLLEAAAELALPVLATEQYPQGLGPTLPELAERLPEPALVKGAFSCLREPAVAEAISACGRRQLVVTGIEAHVCVLQTALDLLAAGYEAFVPHDAVSSRRREDKRRALERMAAAGVVVSSTESVLFELLERCDAAEFRAIARLVRQIPVD